jgi:archaemetzincin
VTPRLVEIVPLDFPDRGVVDVVRAAVAAAFGLECRIAPPEPLPPEAFEPRRGQHHATRILEHLACGGPAAFRRLGVTGVDLFIPIMRHAFGEAMLGGRAAVFSVRRLADEPFSVEERPALLARAAKEAIHELGHTLDLTHCDDPACVMAAALDVAHIDAKSDRFCRYCRVAVADGLGSPVP